LLEQSYDGAPIRVEVDDRDLRGGEKKWHHVKRGVPIRLEVGPKDIEKNAVFFSRRDEPKAKPVDRGELVASIGELLADIQQTLYDRADKLRQDHTVTITNEADFRDYFTPANPDAPEIHGGFAVCHFADEPSLEPLLKDLKVTIRCVPSDGNDTPGTCFATGKPAEKQAIFAKAY
jgi:prolyl-tRNA synthetase